MAMDPNFALRTHEHLFTGRNPHVDEGLRRAAWSAVPKCNTCGAAVIFDKGKVKHYDGRWDKDLNNLSIADRQEITSSGPQMDRDHAAVAEVPDVKPVSPHASPKMSQEPFTGAKTSVENGVATTIGTVDGVKQMRTRGSAETAVARGVETRRVNARERTRAFNEAANSANNFDADGIMLPASQRQIPKPE